MATGDVTHVPNVWPNETSHLLLSIEGAAVSFLVFLALFVVKAVMYSCLVHNARVTSRLQRRLYHHHFTTTERGVIRVIAPHDNAAVVKLQWYLSDLAGDVIVYVTQLILALHSLHGAALKGAPFLGEDAFAAVETILYFATGNIGYRLVTSFFDARWKCSFKISALHNAVALFLYISIFVTRENTLLGIVAMVANFCLLFTSINRVIYHEYYASGHHGKAAVLTCWLRVSAIAVFGCALPAIYIAMAIKTQSVWSMSYYSVGLFIIVIAFFAISNMITMKAAIDRGLNIRRSVDDVVGESNETSSLFRYRPQIRHIDDKTSPIDPITMPPSPPLDIKCV